ncbi:hypothetical protein EO98_03550 [Methanosarcina sp. 2.H.T.1A.6]|uniref:hypothetical protein n=1 Tax=unclassified Methanosarcina TaxID=2644672 RepID=UPI000621C0CD|nr:MULTISPECIES: hypothetical protein [unclassified Methanosarcina]KKG11159.1 hypothetical protein EO97_10860 [Methanosarcina sp. 2.H.T.1A.15]KKG18462.1 hypothetical protein EO94_04605 [Methanosarcina sp. 2.H.T.1A.3]KKG20663.1 hypothetical protein EO98_03550 [Methanosarcina sp. 2.H.T.1A.6]KKG23223.1 hypothetical protein EO96_02080 [Methanosarcina sp. 2.H.T.1A.8]
MSDVTRDEYEKYILERAEINAEAKRVTEKVIQFRKALIEAKRQNGIISANQIQAIAAQESDPIVRSALDEIVNKIIQPKVKPIDTKKGSKRSLFDLLPNSGRC